ncbi:hypothetical protein JJQ72_08600 [Paenibacillus sp. F411]|uniref:Uncharacterized protein n=1 Tax=Paenibacillus algicola TaxID=2565926 RepID=A0A4P8XHN6_9BACL|nr:MULTISPECIES: hypothetical protein [Paenibacillus]MBO2944023.1 hypothetical protein [Paenibacillus sp. F411]QCT01875.1 hypothetical protein E6C60_1157 [Paenibacillus algicola]
MRNELNRNSFSDVVRLQYESMDPLDPMTDIPEDETRNMQTTTSQSLSSEEADHSGFSQDEAGPADGNHGRQLNPDASAMEAWRVSGAEPENDSPSEESRYAGETPRQYDEPLGEDANSTYLHGVPQYNPAYSQEAPEENAFMEADMTEDAAGSDAEDGPLEDVPDADTLQADSPVDPAFPTDQDQHGIDLLNGAGGVDGDEVRKLPEDF